MYVCMYVYGYVCNHIIDMYIYICIKIFLYMYIYIYIYICR